ncbi:S8 family serine peptidase, partial [Planctomycetota bacterium]
MDVAPELGNRFKARATSIISSGQTKDLLCVIIPSLPAQKKIEDYLSGRGIKILRVMSPHGYVAKGNPQILVKLHEDPLVYWVGEVPWYLKIDPVLAGKYSIPDVQNIKTDFSPVEEGKVWITLYDKDDKNKVRSELETEGLLVERYDEIMGAFLCWVFDSDKVMNIAHMPEVSFIQAPRVITTSLETSVALCGDHDIIRDSYNYGENIIIGLIDSGFEIDHAAFMGRGPYQPLHGIGWNVSGKGVPDDVWDDNSIGHGTHVGGIMLSRWLNVDLDGMAPHSAGDENHRFRVVRCGRDTGNPLTLYNIDQAMGILASDNEALAINCSWGGIDNTGSDFISVLADAYVWANQQIYVVAAGNSGPAAGSINTPASAKNIIAVGNVNNGTLALESDSSEGPTRDGRGKPDIYAPGRYVTSADASNLNGSVDMAGT